MNKKVKELERIIKRILKENGVISASLFGSILTDNFSEDSDIDILIEFAKGKTLLDLVDLKMKLEAILNREVDLITFKSLSPYLKDSILSQQVPII